MYTSNACHHRTWSPTTCVHTRNNELSTALTWPMCTHSRGLSRSLGFLSLDDVSNLARTAMSDKSALNPTRLGIKQPDLMRLQVCCACLALWPYIPDACICGSLPSRSGKLGIQEQDYLQACYSSYPMSSHSKLKNPSLFVRPACFCLSL